ncbi:hypothetical protein [Polaromonas sp. AER18D-145]|uniref:hypothetical protein n=1 Tax=Polaromonas sp. AER18D-145 TaxID=1977060 RepID=UPI0011438A8B|nr:hypothetical protein [Polaromonas sp. AER18D-145]
MTIQARSPISFSRFCVQSLLGTSAWGLGTAVLIGVAMGLYFYALRDLLMGNRAPQETAVAGLIPADALYYMSMAAAYSLQELLEMFRSNIWGPIIFVKLMGSNADLICGVNFMIFGLAVAGLAKHADVRIGKFVFLLLLNPLVLLNLLTPNKEILSIFSMLFLIVYVCSKNQRYALMALACALFGKLEIFVLAATFLAVYRFPARFRSILVVVAIIVASLFYSFIGDAVRIAALSSGAPPTSIGVVHLLHELGSRYGLFVVIAVPRLLLVLMEGPINLLRFDAVDIYLLVPMIVFSLLFSVFFLSAAINSRFRLADDVFFLLVMILFAVVLVPFIHQRYLLPAYPLVLFLALRKLPQAHASARIGPSTLMC